MKIFFLDGAWSAGIYQMGVYKFLRENIDEVKYNEIEFHGQSAGAWIACAAVLKIDPIDIYKIWLNEAIQKRKKRKLLDMLFLKDIFEKSFTLIDMKNINNENRIKDKLIVYTTNLGIKKEKNLKYKLNFFEHTANKNISSENLFDILMGSSYLAPLVDTDNLYYIDNQLIIDGGFTNMPQFRFLNSNTGIITDHYDEDIDIIISGYNGKDNVAVKYNGSFDLKPTIKLPSYISGLVFPPSKKWIESVFNLGYRDAKQLLNNKKFQTIM
jgi:hypothetical protein